MNRKDPTAWARDLVPLLDLEWSSSRDCQGKIDGEPCDNETEYVVGWGKLGETRDLCPWHARQFCERRQVSLPASLIGRGLLRPD